MDFSSIIEQLTVANVVVVMIYGATIWIGVSFVRQIARMVAGFFDGTEDRRSEAMVRLQMRRERNKG